MSRKVKNDLKALRHSAEHVLTQAMLNLYPGLKMAMGPATEEGFYFDFEYDGTINKEDFPKIEKEMQKIIDKDLPFKREELEVSEARKIFPDNPYKQEWLDEIEKRGEKAVIYKTGDEFVDLCAGPHLKSTGKIGAFKLLSVAGAYWRGDEKNAMLTRIYGTAFKTEKELESFLKVQEEAEKRDHRKIGKELELFNINEEIGPGLVLWHPKGAIIREIIEDFWKKEHQKRGYQLVFTPHIGKLELWKKSGHWEFYRENMFPPIETEKEKYLLKPMNCPFHCQIYKSKIRSHRDLPLRICELGAVYRYEKEGVLHGLMRVRGFTQDDAHIFCQPEKLTEEIKGVLDLAIFMLNSFGFKEYKIDLSLRDPTKKEKYLGTEKTWKKAENSLIFALKKSKLKYEKAIGEAIFYGPKIDIHLIDSLGRTWQGPTIQIDFNFPEKFDLNFINQKGRKQRVVMIHRTVLGSMERFFGTLIEHYGGALPLWLSPEQIWIIPVGSRHEKYANFVNEQLTTNNFRTKVREENETVSKKIRDGEIQKIPYLLVVGDKEMKSKSVRVRERGKGDIGIMKLNKFLEMVKREIEKRK